MRNTQRVKKIGSQRDTGHIGYSINKSIENITGSQSKDFLRDDSTVQINKLKFHSILERNNVQHSTHMRDGFSNNIIFGAEQEVFDDFQRTFDGFDLNSEVLEFINFSWVLVGVSTSEPNITRGDGSGFGRLFDDFLLKNRLQFNVGFIGEDVSFFTNKIRH